MLSCMNTWTTYFSGARVNICDICVMVFRATFAWQSLPGASPGEPLWCVVWLTGPSRSLSWLYPQNRVLGCSSVWYLLCCALKSNAYDGYEFFNVSILYLIIRCVTVSQFKHHYQTDTWKFKCKLHVNEFNCYNQICAWSSVLFNFSTSSNHSTQPN